MAVAAGVDVGWSADSQSRGAVAFIDGDRRATVATGLTDDDILALLAQARPSVVTLDIPIEASADLSMDNPFRPTDRTMASVGIPVLPSYMAGQRGVALRDQVRAILGDAVPVYETYPYASYKALAFQEALGVHGDARAFRVWWPPKYKRGRTRAEREEAVEYLRGLLTRPPIGLRFDPPFPPPGRPLSQAHLTDGYDACLAAMAGVYLLDNSPMACVAGDDANGAYLLVADAWLQAELKKSGTVTNPPNGS